MSLETTLWTVGIALFAITLSNILVVLRKGSQSAKDATKGTAFGTTIGNVLGTIDSILANASNTIVVELKEKTSDGKLTKVEIEEIIQHVKQEALSLIGKDAELILVGLVGDYDKWLQTKITPMVVELAEKSNAEVES